MSDPAAPYEPVVDAGPDPGATSPHGLDRDVVPVLPALWYFLHLPRLVLELVDLSMPVIDLLARTKPRHHITLQPMEAHVLDRLPLPGNVVPALIVAPESIIDGAVELASRLGVVLGAVSTADLCQDLLVNHWERLHGALAGSTKFIGGAPKLVDRLDLGGVSVPVATLAHQLRADLSDHDWDDPGLRPWIHAAVRQHGFVRAASRMEAGGLTDGPAPGLEAISVAIAAETAKLRLPVTIGAPGVAAAYTKGIGDAAGTPATRLAGLDTSDLLRFEADYGEAPDQPSELSAINWLVARNAVGGGLGAVVDPLPAEMFALFEKLESHWVADPKPRTVRRYLEQLDKLATPLWTDDVATLVRGAETLTVFSNFPLGVLRLPGDTAPLACRVPVTYRPINPLTRSLQLETSVREVDWSSGFKLLVAECIPGDDPVGAASRAAWDVAETMFAAEDRHGSTLIRADVDSLESLRGKLDEVCPDVLVLSAHGFKTRSSAGVVIGHRACLGLELGDMPPVVVLSSCHVSPRGRGEVSIADLLLRQGALAVLGTHVPVDVRHNSALMIRLFIYITESIAGMETEGTLLEAWRRTQSSNAMMDILHGSNKLRRWGGTQTADGSTVLHEFMTNASVGRLRSNHVYLDSETVFSEIAMTMGMGEEVARWFRTPGYLPESAFYALMGHPERVKLRETSLPEHLRGV